MSAMPPRAPRPPLPPRWGRAIILGLLLNAVLIPLLLPQLGWFTSIAVATIAATLMAIMHYQQTETLFVTVRQLEILQDELRAELDNVRTTLVAERAELEKKTTDLTAANERLKAAQQELVQSEKMASLGQMVAGIAHEVNTPLGISISMASNLEHISTNLREQLDSNQLKKSDLQKYSDSSRESAGLLLMNLKRAADLIQSFKKVAVDQSSEALMDVNLEKTVQDILNTLRPTTRKSGVEVIPSGESDVTLFSDPGALFQVFSNFVNNAVMHAFEDMEGGKKIWITWRRDGLVAEIHFRDNGKGIPAEHLPKVFDPFFTTKRGKGGSGLGLHIVYNLVTQRLKGTLSCSSTPGRGTQFVLRLPLKIAQRREDGTAIISGVSV